MAGSQEAPSLFARLMTLNHEAFAAGLYNTAYHIFAAALHTLTDEAEHSDRVRQVAEAQLANIDATHPEYEHSTKSAATREHMSIFALLARQAQAKVHMAEQQKQGRTS